jgi:hypothetical protein
MSQHENHQQSLPFATAVLELVVDQAVDPYSIHRARTRSILTKLLRGSRDTSMTIMITRKCHIKIGGAQERCAWEHRISRSFPVKHAPNTEINNPDIGTPAM